MTFSDGSFVRHLNINNAIVRCFNSCFILCEIISLGA